MERSNKKSIKRCSSSTDSMSTPVKRRGSPVEDEDMYSRIKRRSARAAPEPSPHTVRSPEDSKEMGKTAVIKPEPRASSTASRTSSDPSPEKKSYRARKKAEIKRQLFDDSDDSRESPSKTLMPKATRSSQRLLKSSSSSSISSKESSFSSRASRIKQMREQKEEERIDQRAKNEFPLPERGRGRPIKPTAVLIPSHSKPERCPSRPTAVVIPPSDTNSKRKVVPTRKYTPPPIRRPSIALKSRRPERPSKKIVVVSSLYFRFSRLPSRRPSLELLPKWPGREEQKEDDQSGRIPTVLRSETSPFHETPEMEDQKSEDRVQEAISSQLSSPIESPGNGTNVDEELEEKREDQGRIVPKSNSPESRNDENDRSSPSEIGKEILEIGIGTGEDNKEEMSEMRKVDDTTETLEAEEAAISEGDGPGAIEEDEEISRQQPCSPVILSLPSAPSSNEAKVLEQNNKEGDKDFIEIIEPISPEKKNESKQELLEKEDDVIFVQSVPKKIMEIEIVTEKPAEVKKEEDQLGNEDADVVFLFSSPRKPASPEEESRGKENQEELRNQEAMDDQEDQKEATNEEVIDEQEYQTEVRNERAIDDQEDQEEEFAENGYSGDEENSSGGEEGYDYLEEGDDPSLFPFDVEYPVYEDIEDEKTRSDINQLLQELLSILSSSQVAIVISDTEVMNTPQDDVSFEDVALETTIPVQTEEELHAMEIEFWLEDVLLGVQMSAIELRDPDDYFPTPQEVCKIFDQEEEVDSAATISEAVNSVEEDVIITDEDDSLPPPITASDSRIPEFIEDLFGEEITSPSSDSSSDEETIAIPDEATTVPSVITAYDPTSEPEELLSGQEPTSAPAGPISEEKKVEIVSDDDKEKKQKSLLEELEERVQRYKAENDRRDAAVTKRLADNDRLLLEEKERDKLVPRRRLPAGPPIPLKPQRPTSPPCYTQEDLIRNYEIKNGISVVAVHTTTNGRTRSSDTLAARFSHLQRLNSYWSLPGSSECSGYQQISASLAPSGNSFAIGPLSVQPVNIQSTMSPGISFAPPSVPPPSTALTHPLRSPPPTRRTLAQEILLNRRFGFEMLTTTMANLAADRTEQAEERNTVNGRRERLVSRNLGHPQSPADRRLSDSLRHVPQISSAFSTSLLGSRPLHHGSWTTVGPRYRP